MKVQEDLGFKAITGEKSRTYIFPDGRRLTVEGACALAVRQSGTHRLETTDGKKYIVPSGWLGIEIDAPSWSF